MKRGWTILIICVAAIILVAGIFALTTKIGGNECRALAKKTFATYNPVQERFTEFNYKYGANGGNCYVWIHGKGNTHQEDTLIQTNEEINLPMKIVGTCESFVKTPNGNFCQYFNNDPNAKTEAYDLNGFKEFINSYGIDDNSPGENKEDLSQQVDIRDIKNDLNNVGGAAFIIFRNTGSYVSLCTNNEINPNLTTNGHDESQWVINLVEDITKIGGEKPVCFSSNSDYCISTKLADGSQICVNRNTWNGSLMVPPLGTAECTSPNTPCN